MLPAGPIAVSGNALLYAANRDRAAGRSFRHTVYWANVWKSRRFLPHPLVGGHDVAGADAERWSKFIEHPGPFERRLALPGRPGGAFPPRRAGPGGGGGGGGWGGWGGGGGGGGGGGEGSPAPSPPCRSKYSKASCACFLACSSRSTSRLSECCAGAVFSMARKHGRSGAARRLSMPNPESSCFSMTTPYVGLTNLGVSSIVPAFCGTSRWPRRGV